MPEWQDGTIKGLTDGRESPYRVLLPRDYASGDRRYPTLFLLHGLFGSYENWTELAHIEPVDGLIVIMPEGNNSWYCDVKETGELNESRVVRDLIPEIDERYRTIKSRNARSIAGNSMGGYGAIKMALKFPELFSFAASMSGAFEAPNWSDQFPAPENWEEYRPSITKVFGTAESTARSENDLFRLVAAVSESDVPEIYFDCGITDPFLAANQRLSNKMREHGIAHKFRIMPGGHDWDYWARQGKFLTQLVSQRSVA
jgi:S-formylglutathione hydrolase FrmB